MSDAPERTAAVGNDRRRFWGVTGAILLGLWAGYLWLGLANPYVGFMADDALYLLMADAYSPWRHLEGAVYDHIRAYSQLPPLFPLLLALVGAGSDHLVAARVYVATAMAVANLLFLRWLLPRVARPWHAAGLMLVVALLPGTQQLVVDLWSEGTYLALFWLLVLAFDSLKGRGRDGYGGAIIGCLASALIGTRTIGVAVLPLVLAALPRRRWLAAAISGAALQLPLVALHTGTRGDSYSSILHEYFHSAPLAALIAQLQVAVPNLALALRSNLSWWQGPTGVASVLLAVLATLGFRGALRTDHQMRPFLIYVASYLAILAVWPFPAFYQRLSWPLLPLLLYLGYCGCGTLQWARNAYLTLLLGLVAVTTWGMGTALARAPLDPELIDFRTTRYWIDPARRASAPAQIARLATLDHALRAWAPLIREDVCVYSPYPQLAMLRLRRPAWPAPDVALLTSDRPWPCPYLHVVAEPLPPRPALYPLAEIAGRAAVVAAAASPGSPRGAATDLLLRERTTRQ